MAQVGHRVDYLAGFCCPVGGLAAGKPRVLCHDSQIYLSNGTEYVYVYDQEGRLMKVCGWSTDVFGPAEPRLVNFVELPWGSLRELNVGIVGGKLVR